MQAIQTKFLSPTNTQDRRIKAKCAAASITVEWNDDLRSAELDWNHRRAAERLVAMLRWNEEGYGTLVSGCLPDGSYCHVLTGRDGKGG